MRAKGLACAVLLSWLLVSGVQAGETWPVRIGVVPLKGRSGLLESVLLEKILHARMPGVEVLALRGRVEPIRGGFAPSTERELRQMTAASAELPDLLIGYAWTAGDAQGDARQIRVSLEIRDPLRDEIVASMAASSRPRKMGMPGSENAALSEAASKAGDALLQEIRRYSKQQAEQGHLMRVILLGAPEGLADKLQAALEPELGPFTRLPGGQGWDIRSQKDSLALFNDLMDRIGKLAPDCAPSMLASSSPYFVLKLEKKRSR
ncbi:MAG: hypothetical protein JXR96_19875 [Deltaproteobacteria bacterium]|nr:hypothetical protein [Deltaproteobacteria bacterium]